MSSRDHGSRTAFRHGTRRWHTASLQAKDARKLKKKRGEAEAQQVRLWWDSWVRSSDAHMQGRTQVLDNVNELRLCKLKGKDARGEARGRGAKGGENSRVTDGEQGKDA